jgi:hypothetical protein
MAARARRRVRGFTPKMVMIASLGERPVPPKPPLSLSSEGGCVEEGGREGGREGGMSIPVVRRMKRRVDALGDS